MELTEAQRKLVEDHLWLVENIAWKWRRRVPSSVEMDDLLQAGNLGLINAAQRFDATRPGASFRLFATYRVVGAIRDYLRDLDLVSKYQRGKIAAGAAEEVVEVGMESVAEMTAPTQTPEDAMMALDFSEQLRALVEGLDGKQRTIIQQYYFADQRISAIASEMQCSESLVSVTHKATLAKLRDLPAFAVRREAFRFALTSGLLGRLGSAALCLFAAIVLTASSLAAQTRVTTPSLSGTPGANPRVWVVMPNGTLAEAELENIALVVMNGKPILRATQTTQPTVVKTKHVVQRENGADYVLTGTLDTVHRNGLLQAEGEDYTIVTDGSGVKTLRFNANAVPQIGDILQIRELR